jgi:pimeloyl-ACP methyl ester carboxylesterase
MRGPTILFLHGLPSSSRMFEPLFARLSDRYHLVAPGFRMALAHPERVEALIVQDAVAHTEGLGANWKTQRAFWADPAANDTTSACFPCQSCGTTWDHCKQPSCKLDILDDLFMAEASGSRTHPRY